MAQTDFADLANRLKQTLKEENQKESKEAIFKMTYHELSQCVITFGDVHVGKKYKEMPQDVRYVTWFAGRYKDSQKPEHVKFLRFLELHVKHLEENKSPTNKDSIKEKPVPKAKNAPSTETVPIESDDESEKWSHCGNPPPMTPDQTEFMALQNRLAQMETVMQQVLMHLSQSQGNPP